MSTWTDTRKALQAAIVRASGLDAARVIWSGQNVDAPALSYASLALSAASSPGQDGLVASTDLGRPAGQEVQLAVVGFREATLSIQVFSSTVAGDGDPYQVADQIRTALCLPSIRAALAVVGVTPFDVGDVQLVPELVAIGFRGRAVLDVRCWLPAPAVSDLTGYIASVGGSLQVRGTVPTASPQLHAPLAGNDPNNVFPDYYSTPSIPFTQPGPAWQVVILFGAEWDGGDVVINGRDDQGQVISETVTATPGDYATSVASFSVVNTLISTAVGTSADTATARPSLWPSKVLAGPQRADATDQGWGAIHHPTAGFTVTAAFAAGWDGGVIIVEGLAINGGDQAEQLVAAPGGITPGRLRWSAVTGAGKVITPTDPLRTGTSDATVTLYAVPVSDLALPLA